MINSKKSICFLISTNSIYTCIENKIVIHTMFNKERKKAIKSKEKLLGEAENCKESIPFFTFINNTHTYTHTHTHRKYPFTHTVIYTMFKKKNRKRRQ